MKSLKSRRSAPSPQSQPVESEKKNRLRRPIDVRRWEKLLAYLETHQIKLDFLEVARLKRLESGTMVRHILNGNSAMNELWMLCIAYACHTVPQVIWGEDWPFPHLTPDPGDPDLSHITRRWSTLNRATRQRLLSLVGAT